LAGVSGSDTGAGYLNLAKNSTATLVSIMVVYFSEHGANTPQLFSQYVSAYCSTRPQMVDMRMLTKRLKSHTPDFSVTEF